MKKKTRIILIISIIAFISLLAFIVYNNFSWGVGGELEYSERMFACNDSSKVKKILIADNDGNAVLLQRGGRGGWQLDDGTPASEDIVQSLLSTLMNLRVNRPTSAKEAENKIKVISTAANTVKVEIYEDAPLFYLFGHAFFIKERLVKTFYIGPETQELIGNYAMIEGMMDKVFIIYQPGFRGIIQPKFSPRKQDWVSHQMLTTKPTRIQSLTVINCLNNDESFSIKKVDDRHYDLYDGNDMKIDQYDTTRVFGLLSQFRDKKYQSIATGLDKDQLQRILDENLFRVVTLTDIQGNTIKLNCYFIDKPNNSSPDEADDKLTNIENMYNADCFYATLNDNKDQLYILQYFVFGQIAQTELSQLAR